MSFPAIQNDKLTLMEHYVMDSRDIETPSLDGKDDIKKFVDKFKIDVIKSNSSEIEFDMIGADASFANALRRILIAEVPTMAIDKLFVFNNTSIIQDEVLAHRLGLIPIFADPRCFKYPPQTDTTKESKESDEEQLKTSPDIHIVLELKIKCTKNPKAADDCDPDVNSINNKVLTKHIKWIPIGNQLEEFGANGIRPVFDDILIAKLRPGQELDLQMHCTKGVGKDHAKFSPVATASYRLLPEITLLQPIVGELADRLKKCFTQGVIKVNKDKNGDKIAYVVNPRKDTGTREIFRDEQLKDMVKLEKRRDHFIFHVESTGALPPNVLVEEAFRILHDKSMLYSNQLKNL